MSGTALQLCEKRDSAVDTFPVAIYYPQGERKFFSGTYINYFYLRDRLGSVRGATSDTGSIIQSSDYLPYGDAPSSAAGCDRSGLRLHWSPQVPIHGLILAPYRVLGYANWLSRDPIGERGGTNLYGYVANNPVNYIDPDGLCFTPETLWDLGNLAYDTWTGQWDDFAFDLVAAALPLVPAGASKALKAAEAAKTAGTELSVLRYTQEGETFLRYESANPAFSRVTSGGGVTPGTFAASASDGLVPVAQRPSVYNLPTPEILRPNVFTLRPPPGTPVIGPRSVVGGTGNEVIFPNGF